jgi:hypothetical protein
MKCVDNEYLKASRCKYLIFGICSKYFNYSPHVNISARGQANYEIKHLMRACLPKTYYYII